MKKLLRLPLSMLVGMALLNSCQQNESLVDPGMEVDQTIESLESLLKSNATVLAPGKTKAENYLGDEKVETTLVRSPEEQAKIKKALDRKLGISNPNSRTFDVTATTSLYDVGVLAETDFWGSSCPYTYGYRAVSVLHDSEDNRTASRESGFTASAYMDGNKNIRFSFCVVDGRAFSNSQSGSYAVLNLSGSWAPANTQPLYVYLDSEDNNNINAVVGDFLPNVANSDGVGLNFIYFPQDNAGVADLPSLGGYTYGVFSGYQYSTASANHGEIYSDDEDNSNSNAASTSVNGVQVNAKDAWFGNFALINANSTFRIAKNTIF